MIAVKVKRVAVCSVCKKPDVGLVGMWAKPGARPPIMRLARHSVGPKDNTTKARRPICQGTGLSVEDEDIREVVQ